MCLKGDACNYPSCDCFHGKVWETKTHYISGNLIMAMGQKWECVADHTSNIFGTDVLENKYWKEYDYD